jgi:HEAT repeat protein
MQKASRGSRLLLMLALGIGLALTATNVLAAKTPSQDAARSLTPLQLEIESQRQRLGSSEVEDRREALMRLRSLRHPDASRVARAALNDPSAIVRATAAQSVLALPANESVDSLIPLLSDEEEFVRQQAAYTLGQTRSSAAVAPLIERLTDKKDSVRGAAAVSLGQIADSRAVTSLAAILNPAAGLAPSKKNKSKMEQNPFVLRAAARSLGQIGNRAALPALIIALQDEKAEGDVRREAALALGVIGDVTAIPALNSVMTATDPYLSQAAQEAVRNISRLQTTRGN